MDGRVIDAMMHDEAALSCFLFRSPCVPVYPPLIVKSRPMYLLSDCPMFVVASGYQTV